MMIQWKNKHTNEMMIQWKNKHTNEMMIQLKNSTLSLLSSIQLNHVPVFGILYV